MKHIDLFLTCHKSQISRFQVNMLLFKTYLFITREKNIQKQYKNNKLKIIVSTCNGGFKLPDVSYSDYIKYIIKKYEYYVWIIRINNRLVFKIKDGSNKNA